MSANLRWKHAPKEPIEEDNSLSHDLMFILRKRYWDAGVLTGEVHFTLQNAGAYLRGLSDAKVEDADKLLGLLRDNPEGVLLYHSF